MCFDPEPTQKESDGLEIRWVRECLFPAWRNDGPDRVSLSEDGQLRIELKKNFLLIDNWIGEWV